MFVQSLSTHHSIDHTSKKIHLLEQVCECCEDDLHRLKPKIVNSNVVNLITGLFSGHPNYTVRMYKKKLI